MLHVFLINGKGEVRESVCLCMHIVYIFKKIWRVIRNSSIFLVGETNMKGKLLPFIL